MAFWHRAHSDKRLFQFLVPGLTPVSLLESTLLWNCHAIRGHWKRKIFTSIVWFYIHDFPYRFQKIYILITTLLTRLCHTTRISIWSVPLLFLSLITQESTHGRAARLPRTGPGIKGDGDRVLTSWRQPQVRSPHCCLPQSSSADHFTPARSTAS
jgi:hypothetical protein